MLNSNIVLGTEPEKKLFMEARFTYNTNHMTNQELVFIELKKFRISESLLKYKVNNDGMFDLIGNGFQRVGVPKSLMMV